VIVLIIFIEGFTELCVHQESIVYKYITSKLPPFIPSYCGWCFSLQVSIVATIMWLLLPNFIYFILPIVFWRLSNILHTFTAILIRKKVLMR
jgi:hypothetical protein